MQSFRCSFFTDYMTNTPLDCDRIRFYHQSDNEDKEPLLAVHSYDQILNSIDYAKILDTVGQNKIDRRRRAIGDAPSEHTVPRRSSDQTPLCDVISLNITSSEIPKREEDEEILLPTKYDAGICGGNCGNTMPQVQNLEHNVLIHMLQGLSEFHDRHGYHITRCCAPIKYAPLEVIVLPPCPKAAYSRIIQNMKITQCECLAIVDFSNKTS